MDIKERAKKFATRNYLNSDGDVVCSMIDPEAYDNAVVVATTIQKEMVDRASRTLCDLICDIGRCGMCYHKHDGAGQVKNTFQYDACEQLKLLRHEMNKDYV